MLAAFDPQQFGYDLGATLVAMLSAGSWIKSRNNERRTRELRDSTISKNNEDLVKALQAQLEEWKDQYKQQHSELQDYREKVHAKAKEDQAKIIQLAEDNALLRERTDLKPVLDYLTNFSEVMKNLTTSVNHLIERIEKQTK